MRLSLQTDYALRILLYLAFFPDRATVRQVADFFGISADHVAKAVNLLSRLGYVRSVRGSGGGIELGKPAELVKLGEVILAVEGNMHLLECVERRGVCVIESFCKLKHVLSQAEQVQLDYLNGVTLQDLLPTSEQMQSVLALRRRDD